MRSTIHIAAAIITITLFSSSSHIQNKKTVSKNGMTVSWHHIDTEIHVEMTAPTRGWVTIGFNETSNIKGNYLLMGWVVNGTAEVVEHYTLNPGEYQPIAELGDATSVTTVGGEESGKFTTIRFTIPINSGGKYAKNLAKGSKYILLLAFSRDDDFQHHSMMRTSIEVVL